MGKEGKEGKEIKSSKAMTLDDSFTFGKYRGRRLDYVLAMDIGYVSECISEVEGFELSNGAYAVYREAKEFE